MLINERFIKKTTNLSILIQLITGIITLNGLNIKVRKKRYYFNRHIKIRNTCTIYRTCFLYMDVSNRYKY